MSTHGTLRSRNELLLVDAWRIEGLLDVVIVRTHFPHEAPVFPVHVFQHGDVLVGGGGPLLLRAEDEFARQLLLHLEGGGEQSPVAEYLELHDFVGVDGAHDEREPLGVVVADLALGFLHLAGGVGLHDGALFQHFLREGQAPGG